MATTYISDRPGESPYHIATEAQGILCGAEIISDSIREYTEEDVNQGRLQLHLCEPCFTTFRSGGLAWTDAKEDEVETETGPGPSVPAVVEPPIPSPALAVERAKMELSSARTNYERLLIRDRAQAAREAARILGLREVQVDAAEIVALAERGIAKANPPTPPEERSPGRGGNTVISDNDIPDALSGEVVRQIRQAHDKLTDEQFQQVAEQAREKGEPLTRAVLKREGKKLNPPSEPEPDEPKQPTRTERLEAEVEALSLEIGALKQEKSDLQMQVDWFEAQKSDYDVDHYKRVNDQQAEIRTLQGRLNRLTNEKEEARRQARYWKAEAMKLGWRESQETRQPEFSA